MTFIDNFPAIDREWLHDPTLHRHELATRSTIYREYGYPEGVDPVERELSRIRWRGNERVLDAGCGAGTYFDAVRRRITEGSFVAGEMSLHLVDHQYVNGMPSLLSLHTDTLPFAADTFDVVMANHLLDAVPDIHETVRELRRVLRPDGVLLASAHGAEYMPELETLYRRAYMLLGAQYAETMDPARRFQVDNGAAVLAQHFYAVARHDVISALVFPDVAPLMDYLESTRPTQEAYIPPDVSWEMFLDVVESLARQIIDYFGGLVINKYIGVFVATDSGGFVAPMLDVQRDRQAAKV
jgi:SAM-dependent methyltransferase